MSQKGDKLIIADLASNNRSKVNQAMKSLYTQHFPVIASFIKKNNGKDDDAADIFQDALIVFYDKVRLGTLELNCSIRTYLYSICKNLWLNRLRIQKRTTTINDEMESIPIEENASIILETNEKQKLIMQLISKMGEDCKKVLMYYYFNRWKMKEIATQMNFANEQVAKNKKSSCMKKLKTFILDSPGLINLLK